MAIGGESGVGGESGGIRGKVVELEESGGYWWLLQGNVGASRRVHQPWEVGTRIRAGLRPLP